MCFDSVRGVSLLLRDSANDSELWAWNGSDWELLAVGGPQGRREAALVFDSARGVAVFFGGGEFDDHMFGDVWEWDGAEWSKRCGCIPGPGVRRSHGMAYDSARGVTVLYGGVNQNNKAITETWEWDGEEWTERLVDGPGAHPIANMAYDSARGVCVLIGAGKTWEWDGQEWTVDDAGGPDNRPYTALVFDDALGRCILFGGIRGIDIMNDTWAWDGQTWTEFPFAPEDRPWQRRKHAMAYDSQRNVTVMFGGGDKDENFNDTWEFACFPPCYPDFDQSGILDLFDFLAFLNAFNDGDPKADCDLLDGLNFFDFLCFVNAFNDGCP